MNPVAADAVSEISFAKEDSAPAVSHATRPFYWSVRRELWENKAIYIAPLTVAAMVLIGFFISTTRMPDGLVTLPPNTLEHPTAQSDIVALPFAMVGIVVMAASFLVGVFYCLDALYGERRDRSILFWNSMPMSDLMVVSSKAFIPMVVLPVVAYAVILATQVVVFFAEAIFFHVHGLSLWALLPFGKIQILILYLIAVVTLWYAPIYGYLLAVSVLAKRATFLWAVMPWFVLGVLETLSFHTKHVSKLLADRFVGFHAAYIGVKRPLGSMEPLSDLSPSKFLMSHGLWGGLLFAVVCFVVVVRIRRYRGPI